MKTPTLFTPVKAAILLAYADCHNSGNDSARNLRFRAPAALSRDEAVSIMEDALGRSTYNAFKPALLRKLPDDAQVTIAREGSVCVYVKGNPLSIPAAKADAYGENAASFPQFKADEISYDAATDETRLWYD